MFGDDGENGSDRQSNGGISRGGRDWEFWARYGNSNRRPCRDRRGTVRASVVLFREDDTPGRRGEEDEESDIEEDRDDGSDELGNELVPRLGPKEVTRLEITRHIRGLRGRSGRNDTSGQVEGLGSAQAHASRSPDTTEDELRGLGHRGDRVNIRLTGTLDSDEGKEETKDESEDGLPDIEVEESGEDGNRDDRTDEQSTSPPQGRDAVLHRSLILIFRVQLALLE